MVEHAVVPVDGAEGALEPLPLGLHVARQRGVRVLQQRDEHQEHVHHQERSDVHLQTEGAEGGGRMEGGKAMCQ